jgi:hypothetical protein
MINLLQYPLETSVAYFESATLCLLCGGEEREGVAVTRQLKQIIRAVLDMAID